MHKFIGILFAIACFSVSTVSNSIMGAGLWFWVIIAAGCIVAVSQFFLGIRGYGSGVALLLGFISIFAVILGIIAATIGGSFRMDDNTALLLFLFSIVAVLGIVMASLYKKSIRPGNNRP